LEKRTGNTHDEDELRQLKTKTKTTASRYWYRYRSVVGINQATMPSSSIHNEQLQRSHLQNSKPKTTQTTQQQLNHPLS
jgi:hypothetical protein